MHRVENVLDRQIGDQAFDLAPAREMDVVAQHAILLGARSGGATRLYAMHADQRMGIFDRCAIGQKWCRQMHGVPVRCLGTVLLKRTPHRAVPNRDEDLGKVNRTRKFINPKPCLDERVSPLCRRASSV